MIDLPNKPSDLVELALNDLIKCEQDPRYEIEMCEWHKPNNDKCSVCFAGSVMAQTLGREPDENLTPSFFCFGESNAMKLRALDSIRSGHVAHGLRKLYITTDSLLDFNAANYNSDPELFKSQMFQLVIKLREIRL